MGDDCGRGWARETVRCGVLRAWAEASLTGLSMERRSISTEKEHNLRDWRAAIYVCGWLCARVAMSRSYLTTKEVFESELWRMQVAA